MSRIHKLFAPLGLSLVFAGATFAACGGRPGSPGEMPPVAPRPTPTDPSGSPGGMPNPNAGSGLGPSSRNGADAGSTQGPVSARVMQMSEFAAAQYGVASNPLPSDAGGDGDGYTAPLPPIPDGGVPLDSRIEPRTDPVPPPIADPL